MNFVGKAGEKRPGSDSHSRGHARVIRTRTNTLSLCSASQALSSESVERLPVFNKSALRHYQTSIEADDWCMPSRDPKKLGNSKWIL